MNTSAQISGSSRDDAFQEPEKRPSLHSRTRAVGDVTSPHTRHTRTVTMKVAFKTLCVPDADARDPRPRSRAHPAARRVGARSFSSRFAPREGSTDSSPTRRGGPADRRRAPLPFRFRGLPTRRLALTADYPPSTNAKFEVELEPGLKIAEVKAKVAETQSQAVETMVLVHKGKVLTDDATLADAGVTEASFIVVMQQKPKAAP